MHRRSDREDGGCCGRRRNGKVEADLDRSVIKSSGGVLDMRGTQRVGQIWLGACRMLVRGNTRGGGLYPGGRGGGLRSRHGRSGGGGRRERRELGLDAEVKNSVGASLLSRACSIGGKGRAGGTTALNSSGTRRARGEGSNRIGRNFAMDLIAVTRGLSRKHRKAVTSTPERDRVGVGSSSGTRASSKGAGGYTLELLLLLLIATDAGLGDGGVAATASRVVAVFGDVTWASAGAAGVAGAVVLFVAGKAATRAEKPVLE